MRRYFSTIFLFGLLGCGAVFPQSTEIQPRDRIHYGDVVEIDVVGSFEFDWRGGLTPEGFLQNTDAAWTQVYALCRTETEVADDLEREFSKSLRDPKVKVRIIDRSGRATAYVDGAVRIPQRFQIKRPVNLDELLVLSGGITDAASGEISIFRPQSLSCGAASKPEGESFVNASKDGAQTRVIKISDLLKGDPDSNPRVLSGDIVTVIEALPIYVIGGVNTPRQLSSRSQITLSRAIASAGGLSKQADGDTVTIFRRKGGESQVIEANLKKIESGEAADPQLQAYDVIEVPQKGRPKNTVAPVIDRPGAKVTTANRLPLRIIE